jgi:hypothetical protein
MGITICEKHGRAGIVELCPHAAADITNGDLGRFHRIEILDVLIVCEECLSKCGLSQFEHRPSWFDSQDDELFEAYGKAYELLDGRQCRCMECVAAVEVSQARKEGRPDPYPVYERTLTSNHHATLDDLKDYLARKFKFRHTIIEPDGHRLALFVEGGNYRKPMTVKVYYVIDANEQDLIVSLVTDFIKDIELNQCRIVFLETEVWNTWSNPEKGVSGGSRGPEKLLREVFVNYLSANPA